MKQVLKAAALMALGAFLLAPAVATASHLVQERERTMLERIEALERKVEVLTEIAELNNQLNEEMTEIVTTVGRVAALNLVTIDILFRSLLTNPDVPLDRIAQIWMDNLQPEICREAAKLGLAVEDLSCGS